MLISLMIGCSTVLVTMIIQVVFVVIIIRYLLNVIARNEGKESGLGFDIVVISIILSVLFTGHLIQMAIWAMLFMELGQFESFLTAFYHSGVNFASLGYGDIVMSDRWRLLGALEAGVGVLMFGLSTSALFAVMTRLFAFHNKSVLHQKNRTK